MTHAQDELMMQRAVQLSMKARLTAPPNPWVGCVIVNHGEIIGEGYTQPPGYNHAEVVALQQAKENAKGATVYSTLEPCSHFGRTPPCAHALVAAGVSRVVIGLQDPDSKVRGQGIQQLRKAGIEVITGVQADHIAESLAPYLHHRKTVRPYCIAKAAISVDGRIAAGDGTSQWISSNEARRETHKLRAQSQAIVIGAGTACADQPRLTVRGVENPPLVAPLRVVLDSHGRVPPTGPLFDTSLAPTLIITTKNCPSKTIESWKMHGVEVAIISASKNGLGVDLEQTLDLLGKRGILQVLIEGGSTLTGAFLDSDLLQLLTLDIGACLIGNRGLPLVHAETIGTLSQAIKLKLLDVHVYGDTIRISYALANNSFTRNHIPEVI